ncbi:suppressor of fused domain protein [Rhodococcus sp. X156]|uniref:suppressor of fused domain protein n=1 Tax=Rhodococcus sp. X156 TaxID=2499145 RepID=UPI000FDC5E4F|nr:suppressor of fused domain protein [Rhodococcus sp. X156]
MAEVLDQVDVHLRTHIVGPAPERASVTFLGVQSLDVLRFGPDSDRMVRYATVGCSRHPMGDPEAIMTDSVHGPRAELVLSVRGGVDGVVRTLAILAAAPVVEGLVLQPDALIDLREPLWEGSAFTAVVLGESDVPELALAEPMDPVRFLEVVPVTGTEAAWVRLRGAQALREAWEEAGVDVRDPGRSAVTL